MKNYFKFNLSLNHLYSLLIFLCFIALGSALSASPHASISLSDMSHSDTEEDGRALSGAGVSLPAVVVQVAHLETIGKLEALHRKRLAELDQMQTYLSQAKEGKLVDLKPLTDLLDGAGGVKTEVVESLVGSLGDVPFSLYNIPSHLENNKEFTSKLSRAENLQKWARWLGGVRYFVGFVGGLAVTLINKSFMDKASTPYLEGVTTTCTYVYGFLEVATQRCAAAARAEEEAAQKHIDEANHKAGRS